MPYTESILQAISIICMYLASLLKLSLFLANSTGDDRKRLESVTELKVVQHVTSNEYIIAEHSLCTVSPDNIGKCDFLCVYIL